MNTSTKLMAMFLLAAGLALGFIIVSESEANDAEDAWTDVSSESELTAVFTNGGNAKLTAKIVLSEMAVVPNGSTVVLDLAGYEITYSGASITTGIIMVRNGGNLTVDDSSSEGTGKITGTTSSYAGIQVTQKDYVNTSDAVLTINGGTIEGYYYGIVGNGSRHNTEITVNGGMITQTNDGGAGIYHPQNGKLTVKGGSITGSDTAIEIRAGELNITGGVFVAKNTPTSVNPNGSGTTSVGCAIAVAQHTTKLETTVKISGGTFYGFSALYQSNPQKNPAADISKVTTTISGGTFECTKEGTVSIYRSDVEVGGVIIPSGTLTVTQGFFSSDPSAYVQSGYEAVLVSGYYYVGEQSTGGDVEVIETETAEDGTKVTTKTDMKVDDSGNVTRATVTVSTDDSVATATIGKSGTTTLSSTTEGTVYLTSESILTIMELSAQISGSDSMALNVVSSGSAVSIGSDAADYVSVGTISLSVTVNSGSSSEVTISLNKNSLEPETAYMLSVEGNSAKASTLTSAGLIGLTPFDLGLYVDDVETELSGSVTVSIPVQGEFDNMRLYCLDTRQFFDVVYSNGVVSATLPHFSTWAIVYDKPVVVVDDDDDILFILEQQKKAQEAASAQTTTEDNSGEEAAVIIAAAAVAGAMLACAFFAFRRP